MSRDNPPQVRGPGIERCKQALSVISASAGETRAEGGGLARAPVFLEDVLGEWRRQRLEAWIRVETEPAPDSARILDEYTLHQALINLLNNAADASRDELILKAGRDQRRLIFVVNSMLGFASSAPTYAKLVSG